MLRAALGILLAMSGGVALSAEPDISGIWMPEAALAEPWQPAVLPLTAEAAAMHGRFDARRHDSTAFCMPVGTPRNTLNTAAYPVEILQRPERITLIFDRLGDVRRIFLDGRKHPEEPVPNWLGHSTARWQGPVLIVETVGLTEQSILTDDGVPHSDQMRVTERFSLIKRNGRQLLSVETEIADPRAFNDTLRTRRYFKRAAEVEMSEGSGSCLLDQWRRRLETINSELAVENKRLKPQPVQAAP